MKDTNNNNQNENWLDDLGEFIESFCELMPIVIVVALLITLVIWLNVIGQRLIG